MSNVTSWLITLVTLVVAICAILAAYGFRGRVTTIGVDLGTTFSVVGVNIGGKVVIISDKGNNIFPSIVSYIEGGSVLVGRDAIPNLSMHPDRTIFNAKRFIGKNLNDPETLEYASSHPFKVINTEGLSNAITSNGPRVHPNISLYSSVGFELNVKGHPPAVSPEEVGTEVLKYLLKITSKFLGHDQVNKAVICVPAKFTPEQRAATGAAYKAAGLKVSQASAVVSSHI